MNLGIEKLRLMKCHVCGHEHHIIDEEYFDFEGETCMGCESSLSYTKDLVSLDEIKDPYTWLSWIENELEDGNRHSFVNLPDTLYSDILKNCELDPTDELALAKQIAITLYKFI